jgi:hypothetical protein
MAKKIALVLGAGASVAMGYPVGAKLRELIISNLSQPPYLQLICGAHEFDPSEVASFVREFRNSQMLSIDAFLARRDAFSEIGKRAIAAILLKHENPDLLHSCSHHDNWYQYFFNKFSVRDWESLTFENISVVTFNYDRTLEHYLAHAMQFAYGKTPYEAFEKLKTLNIIHVYGVLGSCDPEVQPYSNFGTEPNSLHVKHAASKLKVIPEGRQDDETLNAARTVLSEADKIVFLGFGFDSTNLERLDSKITCREQTIGNPITMRMVRGTAMGMTNAEIRKATKETAGINVAVPNGMRYEPIGCLQLLRETLILDE